MTKKRRKKGRGPTKQDQENMRREAADRFGGLLRRARDPGKRIDPPAGEELKPYTGENVPHHDD